ncbi:hypothetical protein DPX16_15347 [Anabarilius grahami]|uniref:Uncharacterized protein n=1 Tax=Anabarilius grahami TaxID=495550 RepID=A0A3N0XXM3_ANAGA|nr:hypothetical protein DPX16_15347 [Anabarilius grahami]
MSQSPMGEEEEIGMMVEEERISGRRGRVDYSGETETISQAFQVGNKICGAFIHDNETAVMKWRLYVLSDCWREIQGSEMFRRCPEPENKNAAKPLQPRPTENRRLGPAVGFSYLQRAFMCVGTLLAFPVKKKDTI